mgnify:FL=1
MSDVPIFQPNFRPEDHITTRTFDDYGEYNSDDLYVQQNDIGLQNVAQHKYIAHGEKVMHHDLYNVDLYADNTVEKTELYAYETFGRKIRLNNWYGLKNSKTEELLDCSPCTETYKLVNHSDLFYKQADMIYNSELPTDNITVIDYLYEKGRRAKREIYFNDLVTNVGSEKDRVKCRVDVFNSVDLTWQFQVFSGAYRNLCRNTLVFGGFKTYQQKARHTKNLDVNALLSKATYSLENWNENKEQMNQWRKSRITDDQFVKLLSNSNIGTTKNTPSRIMLGENERVPNRTLIDYLCQVYQKETEGKNTLWGAYNALTHWSTHTNRTYENSDGKTCHTSTKDAKIHVVQNKRNELVRSLLNSDQWITLECVA